VGSGVRWIGNEMFVTRIAEQIEYNLVAKMVSYLLGPM